jgi:hypothetical protein
VETKQFWNLAHSEVLSSTKLLLTGRKSGDLQSFPIQKPTEVVGQTVKPATLLNYGYWFHCAHDQDSTYMFS